MADWLLSIAMLGALALIAGGIILWRRRGERRTGLLMIVAALVVLANVAVWSIPVPADTDQRR